MDTQNTQSGAQAKSQQPLPLADQATKEQPPKFANLPQTHHLPSGTLVKILPLPWKAYKAIRSQLISVLSGQIGDAVRDSIVAWDSFANKGTGTAAVSAGTSAMSALVASGLLQKIPGLLVEIESQTEDLAMGLISSCCPGVDHDSLSAHDAFSLRRYVLDSIDLPGLLDQEKNLFRGIVGSVMTTLGINADDTTKTTAEAPAADSVNSASSSTGSTTEPQTSSGTTNQKQETTSPSESGGVASST